MAKKPRTIKTSNKEPHHCPFCGAAMELEAKDHTMQQPTILYQWRCPCGWFSKLFRDTFEARQFFARRNGVLPKHLLNRGTVRITQSIEDAEPPDVVGGDDETLNTSGLDFEGLAKLRDRAAAYTGEGQQQEEF